METPIPTQGITLISLFRKYEGDIKKASSAELKATGKYRPEGMTALQHLFETAREYEREVKEVGSPRLCWNTDGLCDEERCYCK